MLHLLVINFAKSWLDHYNRKIMKIDTPPWNVNVGRHPRIRLAMVCESKGWGECQAIYKSACFKCLIRNHSYWFGMEDNKYSIASC